MIEVVQVGQRYTGWNRTWIVMRVWPKQGVAEIADVVEPSRKMRLPFGQFKTLGEVRP